MPKQMIRACGPLAQGIRANSWSQSDSRESEMFERQPVGGIGDLQDGHSLLPGKIQAEDILGQAERNGSRRVLSSPKW